MLYRSPDFRALPQVQSKKRLFQKTNHHAGIINLFDTVFVDTNKIVLNSSFADLVYQINQNQPTEEFAKIYIQEATDFFVNIENYRIKDLANEIS